MRRVRLTVLGSANAFSSGGRGNAAYLVDDPRGAFTVDFGPTALRALRALDREPEAIDAVLLTHLHGDHFGGLHLLFIDAMYRSRRRRALTVAGPPGTARTVEAWIALAWGRAARRRRPFALRYVEYAPGSAVTVAGRRVRVFAARHQSPPEVSTCLRVETGGRTLAFSGDTRWTEELVELSRGADLFVCECTGALPTPKHLSWVELAPQIGRLEARRILLSHLSDASRRALRTKRGRVRPAEDGMVVEL